MPATLEALIRQGDQPEQQLVASPAVGTFRPWARPGDLVQAGEALGELTTLTKRAVIVLPRPSPILRVASRPGPPGGAPVDYASALFVLEPAAGLESGELTPGAQSDPELLDLPPGARPILASIEGQFYRSPNPDAPPFIQEGDVIKRGQVIGLVEVMKFFYEVTFELNGFEAGAQVVRVVVEDGVAVSPDQIIAYAAPV